MSEKTMLARNGATEYCIVTARDAIPAERHAAEELKHFLGQITGAEFPIFFDDEPAHEAEILVGDSARVRQLSCGINLSSLGQEGFTLKTLGKRLLIVGGRPRGTLYGVYTFLEKYLGCRWFTPRCSRIPQRSCPELPEIENDTQVPVLEYREIFNKSNLSPDWHARNKCNSHMVEFGDIHGYKMEYFPFVHTFDQLVPVEEYFDAHPEYFSFVNGKRLRERTELCLTNPEVLQISIERVRQWLKDHPRARIISISQNDYQSPCECDACKAIDEREGSHAGALLAFVNQIAEALEPEFPNVIFDTLAYQYTRKAPAHIRPRHNVAVRLCTIECCYSHPHSECGVVASFADQAWARPGFADDLKEWSKISDRLYIWDYATNFSHYLNPFPDFRVLAPNIRFFIENHVTGIFEQGFSSSGRCGEFNNLRQYVAAKLLWDASLDTDPLVNEFLQAVYRGAAGPVREYYDLMHQTVEGEETHMGIYDPPDRPYYTEDFIRRAEKLFDRAEELADDESVLEEVQLLRLSVRYLKISHMPADDPAKGQLVEEFGKDLQRLGVETISEAGLPIDVSMRLLREGSFSRLQYQVAQELRERDDSRGA